MSMLSKQYFHNEAAAFAHLEAIVWPDGPTCPHCGGFERISPLEGVKDKKGRVRLGLYKCYQCRKQFTVRVGTVFESAHIPLHKCLQAVYLMCASKKGVSAHQLHRTLEVTYKSAWFLAHRIRLAMQEIAPVPVGGTGETVEIDETVIGFQEGANSKTWPRKGQQYRNIVLTLVQRGGGARSFHIEGTTTASLIPIIRAQVGDGSMVMTDTASWYRRLNKDGRYAGHEMVDHSRDEYVRGLAHTNTVEGFYSIFKRGMKGVYQHCSEKHLHRYLAEFDFRYSNRVALGIGDESRAGKALKGISGKRLTYGGPSKGQVG